MPTTLSDYEVLETIGEGSYGVCKKIRRKKDGKVLVWKELDYGCMTETEKSLLVSEVNLLRELRHKYIVRYHDRIIDRGTSKLYIVMEFCEGGDVCSLIKKLKKEGKRIEEHIAWKICTQVLMALHECHSRTKNGKVVLHRDLKPANVFLDCDMNVKLGDFGLARVLSHDTSFARTYVGTPYYMSPEQMNHMSYNEKSDVWSLGCLLYELTALKPPFTASGIHELTSKINMGRFARIPFRYSDELNKLICTLLQVDETRRPSVEDLLEQPEIQREIEKLQTSPTPRPDSARSGSLRNNKHASTNSSDEGYSSKVDSLKRKEEALKEREEALKIKEALIKQKEKDLETREKTLLIREKIADERLSRAERLSAHFQELKVAPKSNDAITVTSSAISSPPASTAGSVKEDGDTTADLLETSTALRESKLSVDIPLLKTSILSLKDKKLSSDIDLPKKKVSFLHVNINDKENQYSHIELPKTFQSVERQLKMAEHSRQLFDLQNKTRFPSYTRTRSSVDLTSYTSQSYDFEKMRSRSPWRQGLR